MKYRKKPIIIEAIQLDRRYFDLAKAFIQPEEIIGEYNSGEFPEDSCYIEIETLEGIMTVEEGDYIIKGIKGEFYPCKSDIFKASYDLVKVID